MLLSDGAPVALSSRGYDILELLVRCHDRVVSRDEIVAHVWRGITVGDNNLAVQMSSLRRALGEHAGGQALIVNLPGRGYQLVAEVIEPAAQTDAPDPHPHPEPQPAPHAVGGPPPAAQPAPAIPQAPPGGWSPTRRPWLYAIAALLLGASLMLAAHTAASFRVAPSLPDNRLTILVRRFGTVGDSGHTATQATRYREAVLARFADFEDLRLFPEPVRQVAGLVPHFQLAGLLQDQGEGAILTISLTEEPGGQLLHRRDYHLPGSTTHADQSMTALQIISDLRPVVFQSEAQRRQGPPMDALDLVIEAHDLIGPGTQADAYPQAIALAGRAAASREGADRPTRSYYAYLLAQHMLFGSARHGDAEGIQALDIMDQVLRERPFNLVYLYRRVYVLVALGRLDAAEATAEFALRINPDDSLIRDKLGEIKMMQGNLPLARSLWQPDASNAQDNVQAMIAFAEGRYADCLELSRSVIAAMPDAHYTPFDVLLEVATLGQLDRVKEARQLLASAIPRFPEELRTISSQRQAAYVLPDPAWREFKTGLQKAGMTP